MIPAIRRDTQRRAWRVLFFASLSLFVLFWVWVLVAVAAGSSPVSLIRSFLPDRSRGDAEAPIPVSRYVNDEYGVLSITPADNRTASVNRNGRRIVISFKEAMDPDTAHVLRSYDLTTDGDQELDFRNYAWPDAATFTVTFNRDIGPKERVGLRFRFRKAGGEPLRTMALTFD